MQIRALYMYTSFYDRVFTCSHNLSLFLIPMRWQITQVLLYIFIRISRPLVKRQTTPTGVAHHVGNHWPKQKSVLFKIRDIMLISEPLSTSQRTWTLLHCIITNIFHTPFICYFIMNAIDTDCCVHYFLLFASLFSRAGRLFFLGGHF